MPILFFYLGNYEIKNVVTCCKPCNYLKRILSVEEFFNWVNTIHNNSINPKMRQITDEEKLNPVLRSVYKSTINTRNKNILYSIDFDDFSELALQNCFYCGKEPSNRYKHRKRELSYNGLDRVNNNLPYIIENVVPCCCHCNRAKLQLSVDEFKRRVEKIYNHTIINKGLLSPQGEIVIPPNFFKQNI